MPLSDALEWCDRNMTSNYPIVDSASCTSQAGDILPSSFLVDFQAVAPALQDTADTSSFYISSVTSVREGVRVELSALSNEGKAIVCGVTDPIPLTLSNTSIIKNRTFDFRCLEGDGFPGGLNARIIVGSCCDMAGVGTMTFDHSATELISLRVFSCPEVDALKKVVVKTDRGNFIMENDFVLQLGDGLAGKITVDTEPFLGTCRYLSIYRVPSKEELSMPFTNFEDALSALSGKLGNPIRSINGVLPDKDGNIVLETGDCTELEPVEGGFRLSNPCSKPCCESLGDSEDVRSGLDMLTGASQRLLELYESLGTNVNAMQARLASLIASRR